MDQHVHDQAFDALEAIHGREDFKGTDDVRSVFVVPDEFHRIQVFPWKAAQDGVQFLDERDQRVIQ